MAVAAELVELAREVEEQLGRYGVAGRVEAMSEGRTTLLFLVGHGPQASLEVTAELEVCRATVGAERRRIIERLARELASRRRASVAVRSRRLWLLDWIRPILVVIAVAGAIYAAWHLFGRPARDAASKPASLAASPNVTISRATPGRSAALSRADASERCLATKARLSTGGSVGPLDVDGWVVELMLLAPSAALTPQAASLQAFFAGGAGSPSLQVSWAETPDLKSDAAPSTFVVISPDPLATVVPATRSGIRAIFSGKYAAQYFEESSRWNLVRLAAALYEATDANVGALYARCAEGKSHHLGSWFRGADLATSSVALVAAMGLYADVPHLTAAGFDEDPLAQRRALSQLGDNSKRLDRSKLTLLLADDGGMLAARPGKWATITFPFPDGNRASRASLRLTRAARLGPM